MGDVPKKIKNHASVIFEGTVRDLVFYKQQDRIGAKNIKVLLI